MRPNGPDTWSPGYVDGSAIRRRRFPGWLIAVVVVVVVAAVAGGVYAATKGGGSTSGTTYGPSWGQFTAAFPSPPTEADPAQVLSGFKGATAAAGYEVSPQSVTEVFSPTAPVPPPPTYVVAVIQFSSASELQALAGEVDKKLQLTSITVAGNPGYREVIPASTFGQQSQSKVTDPNAFVGVEYFIKGNVLYSPIVIASTTSEATAFLDSVQPVG